VKFVYPVSTLASSYPFIALFDTYQVIDVFEDNLCEYFAMADVILQLAHDLESVAVRNTNFVNSMIVNV
jgi:hypothetical protein